MPKRNSSSGPSGRPPRSNQGPPGVWNRGSKHGPVNPIRVRTKRLDKINGDKLALAFWLLAKQKVSNGTGLDISEEEVRKAAARFDDPDESRGNEGGLS